MASREVETFNKQVGAEVAKQYYPDFFSELKQELNNALDKYIGEHLSGMEVNYDIHTEFSVSGTENSGFIEIDIGEMQGEHTERVRSHRRNGRQVRGHNRKQTNQAAFKIDEDNTVTDGTIPEEILLKQIVYPVLQAYGAEISQ